jgi:uncharacterized membrane protein
MQLKLCDYILLGLLVFFMIPMFQITWRYLPYNTDVGFLQLKQSYIPITHWRIAFFIHVYTSMLVLIAGFTQFSGYILKHYKSTHRILGYMYVINILVITGPASFIMALYANGGWTSQVAFTLLAVLWLYTTGMALYLARKGKYKEHQYYMMRSYALTLSALTLRAWKWAINAVDDDLPPMDVYRAVAWLGFVPNLLVVEWWISKRMGKSNSIRKNN